MIAKLFGNVDETCGSVRNIEAYQPVEKCEIFWVDIAESLEFEMGQGGEVFYDILHVDFLV